MDGELLNPRKSLSGRVFTVGRLMTLTRSDGAEHKHDEEKRPPVRVGTIARKDAIDVSRKHLHFFTDNSIDIVCQALNVDPKVGLTSTEAAARLVLNGRNELEKEPPRPMWKLVLDQFSDLLVIMLICASIFAAVLGHYVSCVVIILIVLANAILGVVQESRAGAALEALASMSSPKTDVLRDGKIITIESEEVVPGDIIMLETGKKISADVRLLSTQGMQCNEMALTGESEPVKKKAEWLGDAELHKRQDAEREAALLAQREADAARAAGKVPTEKAKAEEKPTDNNNNAEKEKKKEESLTEPNMAYMGCSVQDGRGVGVVVKTGMNTKMGDIAHLLKNAEQGDSPLQIKLEKLGVRLGMISLGVSLLVFVIGVSTGRGTDPGDDTPRWLQMLLVAVSLTVAAVPEGLPACVTITLAIGMKEMVKKNALIRNLHSVETLGSASVICTDKTGTLTKGEMTAVRLWFRGDIYRFVGEGFDPRGDLVPMGAPLNQNVRPVNGPSDLPVNHPLRLAPVSLTLWVASICSNALLQYDSELSKWECVGNSSERPLVVGAAKIGITREYVDSLYTRLHENPFNSTRKTMSVLVDAANSLNVPQKIDLGGTRYVSAVKGAPNVVLEKCTHIADVSNGQLDVRPLTDLDRSTILKNIDTFSGQAFRVLAIAYQPMRDAPAEPTPDALEQNLVFCGMIASIDPERKEVPPSIRKAYNAGIRVVMITGDYVKTAKAIAENIGLLPHGSPEGKAIDCEIIRNLNDQITQLEHDAEQAGPDQKVKKQQLQEITKRLDAITAFADVYARAKPVDKITIVRSLQRQGHVCSMTGDGVNDAPALKQANIGVAMGITGTDVAKASSDMVLTDDNFCSIVEAIEQGRTIYANITKFVFYLLSTNSAEVMTILIAVIMGLQSPLVPIQILWLNLVTDGAPAVALAVERIELGVMEEGPRRLDEPLLEKVMATGIAIQCTLLTGVVLGTYIIGLTWHVGTWDGSTPAGKTDEDAEIGAEKAKSMTILVIVFAELLRAYSCRSLRVSVFTMGVFSNRWMQKAVATSWIATIIVANTPGLQRIFGMRYLDARSWLLVLGLSLVPFTVDELTKLIYRRTGYGLRPKAVQIVDNDDMAPSLTSSSDGKRESRDDAHTGSVAVEIPLVPLQPEEEKTR